MAATLKPRALAVPGLLFGAYPQGGLRSTSGLTPWAGRVRVALGLAQRSAVPRLRDFVLRVGALEAQFSGLTEAALRSRAHGLRAELSLAGLSEGLMEQSFALVRAAALHQLGVRPFDTQLMAARVMLDRQLAEMATGEGKTLAAAVCAATAALAGIPVHVVTVNDYLVERDAHAMQALYAVLGLSVGHVVATHESDQRRLAYACDITYCTAKELVFDYLRDRVALGSRDCELQQRAAQLGSGSRAPTLLRGLCMALVDEADSVLIDEARVPLILARASAHAGELDYHAHALALAQRLHSGVDYLLELAQRSATLTARGALKLEQYGLRQAAVWHNRAHRDQTVCVALAALHLYRRDRDYLVQDGGVVIVDESTGRLAPGRIWSRGLHQLIELKEGCVPTHEQVTAAQMTYQRFFARYLRLGGMSGTLREADAELAAVYGLDVIEIPLRCASRRVVLPTRLLTASDAPWSEVIEQVSTLSRAGRPVLIGTDSVRDSESLSEALASAGLAHQVLNARHDLREAQIVALAGQLGRITVATNMAGRGTDIGLGEGVAQLGGLHVICCQHNASRRIDRQLIGRCARQGDPGSAQTLVVSSQPLIKRAFPAWLLRWVAGARQSQPQWLVALLLRLPQSLEERRQRAQRRALQQLDERAERELFNGLQGE